MNVPSNKPSDADREYLQAELTRLVGQGRLDLTTYQDLVDIVWSTENNTDLMQIRARYFGGPPVQQSPAQQPSAQPQQYRYGQPPAQQPVQAPGPHQPPHPHAPHGIPMGGHLPQPHQFTPPAVAGQEPEQSTMGTIKKSGQWVVPAYSAYKLNGSDLHLDLRRATAAAPVVTIDITMNMAAATLVVPPGVHVDVQMASKNWSQFDVDTSAPLPGAPRVVLTGIARASTLKVITKNPNEPLGLWQQVFGS